MITTRVREPRSIDAALAGVDAKLRRNLLRRAIRRGANIVRDEARARAPKGTTGLLKRDIRVVMRRERGGQVRASVGVMLRGRTATGKKRVEAFYARWVEQGHRIVPRRGRAARSITLRRRAARLTGRRVPPYPFLFPAAQAKQADVLNAVMAELRAGLGDLVR